MPSVYGDQLEKHDLSGENPVISTKLSHHFDIATVFCMTDLMRMLCIGGYSPYVKDTYWLSLETAVLTKTDDMQTERGWPGVICIGSWVYAFGGNNPRLKESEKFSLDSSTWKPLPPMHKARYAFTPCLYSSDIYLVELYNFTKAEKFSIASETYTSLHIILPRNSSNVINFINGQEIVFLTKEKQMWTWKLESKELTFQYMSEAIECGNHCSNCPPVKVGNQVIFVIYDTGKMWNFNVDSKETIELS